MTDPIEQLIQSIRECADVQQTSFNNSFLNNVADVFERDGFGTTRAFLMEKKGRRDLQLQAKALLRVLELMATHPEVHQRRAIGRTLIKALVAIKGQSATQPRGGGQRR